MPLKNITPPHLRCGFGQCPAVYLEDDGKHLNTTPIFGLVQPKVEGTWHDSETGTVTDPAEIARLEAARDAELAVEAAKEERIRIANEHGIISFASGRTMGSGCYVVGLIPHAVRGIELYEGVPQPANIYDENGLLADPTSADLSELADIMIDRWQRFKNSLEVKAE